ncbi:hypothetical protein P5673_003354, partial [Acropora cervicornis]
PSNLSPLDHTSSLHISSGGRIGLWVARTEHTADHLHLESMNISQQILALDARYNAYRVHNNPQYRKYSEEEFFFLIQLTIFPGNIA